MRILTINIYGIPSGEISNLMDARVFQDYDAVIVYPDNLGQLFYPLSADIRKDIGDGHIHRDLGVQLDGWSEKRSKELSGLLNNGGIVICFVCPVLRCSMEWGRDRTHTITNYDWLIDYGDLGFDVNDIIFGRGTTIDFIEPSHPFAEYLRTKPSWSAYINNQEYYITRNWKILASAYGTHVLSMSKRVGRGHVILLPSAYDNVNGELIEKCIIRLLGDREPRSMPGWAKSMSVPSQEHIISELVKIEQKMEELTVKLNALDSQNNKLERWKWLLYETGKEYLEPVVREALSLLGYNVEPQPDQDSDGLLDSELGIALLEVEGTKETVKVDKISQLIRNIGNYGHQKGILPKGILVGNPFRENELDQRPPKGSQKQLFSKELIKAAETHSITVLLSTDLYKVVTKILNCKLPDDEKKQLREKINNGKGLVNLFDT